MINKDLYIFSDSYPYGKDEVFLHNEVLEISKHCHKIILLPRFKEGEKRKLPNNVILLEDLTGKTILDNIKLLLIHLFFIKHWGEFFKGQRRLRKNFIRNIRSFYGYCIDGYYYLDQLKNLNIQSSILYSYWFKHSAFAISMLEGTSNIKVVRCHRGDLYEEQYFLPFRKFISNRVNRIFSISDDGVNYLKDHYAIPAEKISINKLGTRKLYELNRHINQEFQYQFASCSAIIPRKRVDKILLSIISFANNNPLVKIKYHHFGNGEGINTLKEIIKQSPANLVVDLHGHTINERIQKFYSETKIDCFINFSTSEGIPVSIMEALSYGIPVLASDVGGTSEIVTNSVGILVPKTANSSRLVKELEKITSDLKSEFSAKNCVQHWEENFSAEENYLQFVRQLKNIIT